MKHFIIFAAAVFITSVCFAQDLSNKKQLSHYVFPEFTEGMVLKKSGEKNKALLNYNSLTQEVIFDQTGRKMALDQVQTIDTVYIQNRKFIPAVKGFYEVATNTPVQLYIQHKCKVTPPGTDAGFGGTSQTSASHSVNNLLSSGRAFALKLPDGFIITPETEYWIKSDKELIKVTNVKQVQKAFPGKGNEINDFARKNKINFSKQQDVVKLVEYCNSI